MVSPPRQESRTEENRRLQLRLREQEESARALRQVNQVLEGQLEAAARSNERLVRDAQRLADNWKELRRGQEEKVGGVALFTATGSWVA